MAGTGSGNPGEIRKQLGPYEVAVATSFGPRVIGFKHENSREMFVTLDPEVSTSHPSGAEYRFRGGHRLWVSPEESAVTYAPDDHDCTVNSESDSLTVTGPKDMAGFEKTIHIGWEDTRLSVEHRLRWSGAGTVEVSPWAITQVSLGGVAILPVAGLGDGPGADRSLVVWPYTRLDDERISWAGDSALIKATPGQPTKMGSGPATSCIGYLSDGHLFTKRFEALPGEYPDRGALAQVYTNELFCELETLGPLVRLEPGADVAHTEFWEIVPCTDLKSAVGTVNA